MGNVTLNFKSFNFQYHITWYAGEVRQTAGSIKGCVCYIFSNFFKSESTCETSKKNLFHCENSFRSRENQV